MKQVEENNASVEENQKRYKMALLYIQTKEIHKLYNGEINNEPKKYYLINKKWLDNYKETNNYKFAEEFCNSFKDWNNYLDFSKKMSKYFQIDRNQLTQYGIGTNINNMFDFSLEQNKIGNTNFSYPSNCGLVKEGFFKDCSDGSPGFNLYNVYIRNHLIIIID